MRMEKKNKRVDIIKNIDKKNNIISSNIRIIDNLFIDKLIESYILTNKKIKIKNQTNYEKIFKNSKKNKKSNQKLIINGILKKVPPYLLEYFDKYEIKKYANKLMQENNKKNYVKKNKSFSLRNDQVKLYSRNNSSLNRISGNYKLYNDNKAFNDDKEDIISEIGKDKNLVGNKIFNKKINQKKYFLPKNRKFSANIYNRIHINDSKSKESNETKSRRKSDCFSISTRNTNTNTTYRNPILDYYNSVNIKNENERKKAHLEINSNLSNLISHTEINKDNQIYDYSYAKRPIKTDKLILDLSDTNNNLSINSIDKIDKKNDSKVSPFNDDILYNTNNLFQLPRKREKIKNQILLKSFSPKEIFITEKASKVMNNLNEIKKEIKFKINDNKKNIKHSIRFMLKTIKKDKSKEVEYLKKEVDNNKDYEYFMKNRKQLERKKSAFKVLRNSFNISERSRSVNQTAFIKTLNKFYKTEKKNELIVKQVYAQNYFLRWNKNKKNAKNIKKRIDKMNEKKIVINSLISKINNLKANPLFD